MKGLRNALEVSQDSRTRGNSMGRQANAGLVA